MNVPRPLRRVEWFRPFWMSPTHHSIVVLLSESAGSCVTHAGRPTLADPILHPSRSDGFRADLDGFGDVRLMSEKVNLWAEMCYFK